MANNLVKGSGCGTREWREDFVLTDTDQTTALFSVAKATGNTTIAGTLTVTGAQSFTGAANIVGNFSVATNKFNVTAASGNTTVAGTLGVTGATTLAAMSATTGAFSGLVTSTVAAGSPVLKAILTNATPTVAFTDSGAANHAPTTAPAGYLQVLVGSTTYYVPVWA